MNKKIIYVDFVFKKRKIPSKISYIFYRTKVRLGILFNKYFHKTKKPEDTKIYPFKKVL